jgi:hypothetical protein
MPYEFTDHEFELEPESSSARGGFPPRKNTAAGVLDPLFPPKRPPGPIPAAYASLFFRVLAGLLLAGLALATFAMLFFRP